MGIRIGTSGTGRSAMALAGLLASAALASPALAAGPPQASTGAAREVGYGSATVTGTVATGEEGTSYYFQYGPTRAYGSQSAIAGLAAGSGSDAVALGLAGLQPLTVYHYRLVAVNPSGTAFGSDRTFQTTSVPLSLAILASPDPVLYGGSVDVQGTLSGTGNADREVVLQVDQFPFASGFQDLGNPELTSATGSFAFALLNVTVDGQYRVTTVTRPPVVSPVAMEQVAVRVSSRIARTSRRGYVRIYGTVTPAEDGAQVGVLRIVRGRGVLVAGTVLRHLDASSSSFSRVVRVRPGLYRVLVRVVGAGQVSNYGQPLLVR